MGPWRAGPARARPRRRLLRLLLLLSAKAGTGPSGVVRVAEGGGPGEGWFAPRSRSRNRVRLVPTVFAVWVRRWWGRLARPRRRRWVRAASGASPGPGVTPAARPPSPPRVRPRWPPQAPLMSRAVARAARGLRARERGREGRVRTRAGVARCCPRGAGRARGGPRGHRPAPGAAPEPGPPRRGGTRLGGPGPLLRAPPRALLGRVPNGGRGGGRLRARATAGARESAPHLRGDVSRSYLGTGARSDRGNAGWARSGGNSVPGPGGDVCLLSPSSERVGAVRLPSCGWKEQPQLCPVLMLPCSSPR